MALPSGCSSGHPAPFGVCPDASIAYVSRTFIHRFAISPTRFHSISPLSLYNIPFNPIFMFGSTPLGNTPPPTEQTEINWAHKAILALQILYQIKGQQSRGDPEDLSGIPDPDITSATEAICSGFHLASFILLYFLLNFLDIPTIESISLILEAIAILTSKTPPKTDPSHQLFVYAVLDELTKLNASLFHVFDTVNMPTEDDVFYDLSGYTLKEAIILTAALIVRWSFKQYVQLLPSPDLPAPSEVHVHIPKVVNLLTMPLKEPESTDKIRQDFIADLLKVCSTYTSYSLIHSFDLFIPSEK